MSRKVQLWLRPDQAITAVRIFQFARHCIDQDAGAGAYVTRRLSADLAIQQIDELLAMFKVKTVQPPRKSQP